MPVNPPLELDYDLQIDVDDAIEDQLWSDLCEEVLLQEEDCPLSQVDWL